MLKKAFLYIAGFILIAVTTFFIVKPNPRRQTEKALLQLKENNPSRAEAILKSSCLPGPEGSFYLGYLEQIRGRFEVSNRYFQTALLEAKKAGNQKMLLEALMAKALNCYFEKNEKELFSSLRETLQTNHPNCSFFEGLERYLQQDYAEALRLWSRYSPPAVENWSSLSIEKLFPVLWRKLHIAHCLIETGDIFAGREILEKESHNLNETQEYKPLANLFLGLSYLKESHKIPFDQRSSYYSMARFYFERTQNLQSFEREKKRLLFHVEAEVDGLLKSNLNADCQKSCFDFIRILQEWGANDSIEHLAETLVKEMPFRGQGNSIELCAKIRATFYNSAFHTKLTQKMSAKLQAALRAKETEELFILWSHVDALSSSTTIAAKEIARLSEEEIFETIKNDNLQLTKTRNYVAFWEKLGRSPHEREVLAQDLLYHAKLFWHNEKQEKKGLLLMEIALKISNQNPCVEKEIALFLFDLYAQAESSNMIRRLALIYEAMEHFKINRQELNSTTTLANYLADAEYHFEARNYPAAKTQAGWVLKLDPKNERARRLAGLSSFNLGEYSRAFYYLKDLRIQDADVHKALTLAKAFATRGEKHLCQMDTLDSFDEDE